MRKHMFLNITVVVALMLAISFCMACSGGQADNHEKIDYTVVENEDLPIELKDPTKEGYEFVGWYDGENEFDFSKKITKFYNLFANFITICEAKGHDWIEATPDRPKTCSRCGATEGEKLPTEKPKKNCKKTSLISILVSLTVLAGCLVIRKKHN